MYSRLREKIEILRGFGDGRGALLFYRCFRLRLPRQPF